MSKKINMQVAMMEYYDEIDRMNEVAGKSVKSDDLLWDSWYALAFMYEPDIQEKFKVDEQDGEEIFTGRPMENRKSKHRLPFTNIGSKE